VTAQPVVCHFYIRTLAGDNNCRYWRYTLVGQDAPPGDAWVTWWPPAAGDLVTLFGHGGEALPGGPAFRVLERSWSHPAHGSVNWPPGKDEPDRGPILDIVVAAAEGLFRDETDEEPE
jgi:hypothetical protein